LILLACSSIIELIKGILGQKSGGWKDIMCVGILLSFEPFSELELWVAEPWRNGYTSFCVIVILSFEFFVLWLLKDLPPGG
jgi:hypothetical protein